MPVKVSNRSCLPGAGLGLVGAEGFSPSVSIAIVLAWVLSLAWLIWLAVVPWRMPGVDVAARV